MKSIRFFLQCFTFTFIVNVSFSEIYNNIAETENERTLDYYEGKENQIQWVNNAIDFENENIRSRRHVELATESITNHLKRKLHRNHKNEKATFFHQVMNTLHDKILDKMVNVKTRPAKTSNHVIHRMSIAEQMPPVFIGPKIKHKSRKGATKKAIKKNTNSIFEPVKSKENYITNEDDSSNAEIDSHEEISDNSDSSD